MTNYKEIKAKEIYDDTFYTPNMSDRATARRIKKLPAWFTEGYISRKQRKLKTPVFKGEKEK